MAANNENIALESAVSRRGGQFRPPKKTLELKLIREMPLLAGAHKCNTALNTAFHHNCSFGTALSEEVAV